MPPWFVQRLEAVLLIKCLRRVIQSVYHDGGSGNGIGMAAGDTECMKKQVAS